MGSGGDFGVNSSYTSNSSIHAFLERWWSSKDRMLAHQHAISLWWLVLSLITIAIVFFLMRELVRRGYGVEAVMLNSALMLLVSPVSWSHHWVWIPLWIAVLLWHWRTATTAVRAESLRCSMHWRSAALVLFEAAKMVVWRRRERVGAGSMEEDRGQRLHYRRVPIVRVCFRGAALPAGTCARRAPSLSAHAAHPHQGCGRICGRYK